MSAETKSGSSSGTWAASATSSESGSGKPPKPSKAPTTDFLERATRDTDNWTTFDPTDLPLYLRREGGWKETFRDWYERLRRENEGESNGNWRNQRETTRQQKQDVADAIAFQLDLTARRRERVGGLMARVNCQRYSNVGGLEMVAFCLCQIVCSEEECVRYYHPQARPDRNDRLFSKVFNDFGFDPQTTANTIQKLRRELNY